MDDGEVANLHQYPDSPIMRIGFVENTLKLYIDEAASPIHELGRNHHSLTPRNARERCMMTGLIER
jgi:hypothetical protein